MESRNVETYRAGHEAFNRRDFGAMLKEYAESISWIDHARGITFRTPQEFKNDFLEGWIQASSDCQVTDARYGRRRHSGGTVYWPGYERRPTRLLPGHRQGVDAADLRDVALRRRRSGRRRRDLLRPGLPSRAAGAAAGAVPSMSDEGHDRAGTNRGPRTMVDIGIGGFRKRRGMIVRVFRRARAVSRIPGPASSCSDPRMPPCRA